jgi:hypothetical protein
VKAVRLLMAVVLLTSTTTAYAAQFEGPGRFCGNSAIIDLRAGEAIEPHSGGIHSGRFSWSGDFGTLEVQNIGWASRPEGRAQRQPTPTGQTRFAERQRGGKHSVAIWNRVYGAAYFSSDVPLTEDQLAAIERVYLIDESMDNPQGCRFRTVFSFE